MLVYHFVFMYMLGYRFFFRESDLHPVLTMASDLNTAFLDSRIRILVNSPRISNPVQLGVGASEVDYIYIAIFIHIPSVQEVLTHLI